MRKSKLEAFLKSWAGQGIITGAQAAAIWEYEARKPSRSWVIFGIAAIGVTAIAAGVVSIVAANWFSIPPSIKLANYFIVQCLLGVVATKANAKWQANLKSGQGARVGLLGAAAVREGALALFALTFFAGIGLVGQIYNLSGDLWRSVGFWTLLALPSALFCTEVWFGFIWLSALLTAGGDFVFTRHLENHDIALRASLFAAVLILFMLPGALRNWRDRASGTGLARAATYMGLIGYFLAGSVYGNVAWYTKTPILRELELRWNYMIPSWIAIALVCVAVLLRRDWNQKIRVVASLALVTAGAFYSVPFVYAMAASHQLLAKVIGAGGFLLVWTWVAIVAAMIDRRWIFELSALCIALRFLVIYFEVFGSLAATGVGLIISGMVILGVSWGWYRYKNVVRQRIGATSGGTAQ